MNTDLDISETEAATGEFCQKNVFLKVSQISQESTCGMLWNNFYVIYLKCN